MRIANILLLGIAFWFQGNTLYWIDPLVGYNETHFLQVSLNKKMPPKVNEERIEKIEVSDNGVTIYTKSNWWVLDYKGTPSTDWYVSGPHRRLGK